MNDESHSLIAEINSSLSLAAKRQNGLFKMIWFLEKCNSSDECTLLEQSCPFWLRTIFQIFENHPVSLHAKLAQYAFYLIIQSSKSLSAELQRHISTSLIEKAINLLISSSDLLAKNSLLCLNELISCYRTPCSQFRTKIENYVYTRLESESDDLIEWSSICYAKLPYLNKNTNNIDTWYYYFKNMLHNANSLLNELFEDYQPRTGFDSFEKPESNEMDKPINISQKSEGRTFAKLTKDSDNLEFYYKKSLKQFKACLSCLARLLEPLSERTCLNVRPNEVIEFFKRIFLFDFKKLQNNCRVNLESSYLNDILNDMLICTFNFFATFVSVLNTNLIPQALVINNILLSIGHSISDNSSLSVLSSYFTCLNSWMVSLGSNSTFFKNSFTIIENLLKKIKPFEKNALSIERHKHDHFKFKHKQKTSVGLNQEKNSLNSFQILGQNKLVTSALDCLRTYLRLFSFNLSYNQFEKIHSSIIDMILYVQYNTNARKPYDQPETRLALYEALYDLCLTKNTKIAPPLSVSIGLFKNAINDQAQTIQQFAKSSLNFLRAFTYPVQPTYLIEYVIESKVENSNIGHQTLGLVLPSINDERKQNVQIAKNDHEQSEIAKYMSTQLNSLNGIETDTEQTNDQVKEIQANKRKFNYEDDDDDLNEEENENAYNPKSIAKKFQPNGHFQNRGLLNGRDVENSNGDDDEEEDELEEEVISLNDQEEEEEDIEDETENEMDDEDEEDEEEEEENEEYNEKNEDEELENDQENQENPNDKKDEQMVEETVVQEVFVEPEQMQPPSLIEQGLKDKSSSPTNMVAEEVKNLLKETGDDYDDEDSKEAESDSLHKVSQTTESDVPSQEVSMNKLEDNQVESEVGKLNEPENENNGENIKNDISKVEEDESKSGENEDFDENKFKQMCASLNVNAITERN